MADFTEFSDLDIARSQMVVPLKAGEFVVVGVNSCFPPGERLSRGQMLERLAEIFPENPNGG